MENLLIQHLQWEGWEIWGLSLTKDMWRRSAVKGREKREGRGSRLKLMAQV